MKKLSSAAVAVLLAGTGVSQAVIYDYNFGTGTGSYTTAGGTNWAALPAAPAGGGTAFVRVSSSGGGGLALTNPGSPELGPGSQLQMTAPTNTSVTKFALNNMSSPSSLYSTQFTMSVSGGTSGSFYFFTGDGSSFGDGNAFNSAQSFTGIRFQLSTSGTGLLTNYRTAAGYTNTGLTTTGIVKDTALTFTIFNNNSAAATTYDFNGTTELLAAGTWDIWLGTTRIGNDLSKVTLPTGNIDSLMFYSEGSSGNTGFLNVDSIRYANDLGISNVPEPGTWALMIGGLVLLLGHQMVKRRRAA